MSGRPADACAPWRFDDAGHSRLPLTRSIGRSRRGGLAQARGRVGESQSLDKTAGTGRSTAPFPHSTVAEIEPKCQNVPLNGACRRRIQYLELRNVCCLCCIAPHRPHGLVGLFNPKADNLDKVAVFLDYENVLRTGHQIFGGVGQQRYETVLNPLEVAERLIAERRDGGMLHSVDVFRGRPVPEHQPKPASANDLQTATWEASDSHVRIHHRNLKYDFNPDGSFVAREKGIDVALAVSLAEGALDQDFTAAIVFSSDPDLLPALEMVIRRRLVNLEIACWSSAQPLWSPEFLRETPSRRLPCCHFLNEDDFARCRDSTPIG